MLYYSLSLMACASFLFGCPALALKGGVASLTEVGKPDIRVGRAPGKTSAVVSLIIAYVTVLPK